MTSVIIGDKDACVSRTINVSETRRNAARILLGIVTTIACVKRFFSKII